MTKNQIEQKVYQDLHAKEAYLQKISSDEINNTGDINAGGHITGKKVGIFAYLPLHSTASSTIIEAGIYQPIEGNFTNNPIEGFSIINTDSIKYDEEKTMWFEIDWHSTTQSNTNSTTVHIGIKINGVLFEPSVMGGFLKFLNEEITISGTAVVELSKNDTIQIVLTSDGTGDIITFDHFTTTISEFFD